MAKGDTDERIAVLETSDGWQEKAIREILVEVRKTGKFVYTYTEKLDAIEAACLPDRVTKLETQQKIYTGVAAGMVALLSMIVLLKEKIHSLFF